MNEVGNKNLQNVFIIWIRAPPPPRRIERLNVYKYYQKYERFLCRYFEEKNKLRNREECI